MYLSYQIMRNLTPQRMTAVEQREIDDQLGRVVAGLARRSRPDRHAAACSGSGTGFRRRMSEQLSKAGRNIVPSRRIARHPAARC